MSASGSSGSSLSNESSQKQQGGAINFGTYYGGGANSTPGAPAWQTPVVVGLCVLAAVAIFKKRGK